MSFCLALKKNPKETHQFSIEQTLVLQKKMPEGFKFQLHEK